MTGLAGEIEQELAVLDQLRHCSRVAHVRQIDSHAVANVVDVEKIAAIFGNQTINECDLRLETDEASGEGRSDESEPTGDQYVRSSESVGIPRHGGIVGRD